MKAARDRLRDAILAVPVRQRDQHLPARTGLLHLLEHCGEGREPRGFVAGYRAYRPPALRWAAERLEHQWLKCMVPNVHIPIT